MRSRDSFCRDWVCSDAILYSFNLGIFEDLGCLLNNPLDFQQSVLSNVLVHVALGLRNR